MVKWEGPAEDPHEPRMTLCWDTQGRTTGGHIGHMKAPHVSGLPEGRATWGRCPRMSRQVPFVMHRTGVSGVAAWEAGD